LQRPTDPCAELQPCYCMVSRSGLLLPISFCFCQYEVFEDLSLTSSVADCVCCSGHESYAGTGHPDVPHDYIEDDKMEFSQSTSYSPLYSLEGLYCTGDRKRRLYGLLLEARLALLIERHVSHRSTLSRNLSLSLKPPESGL
jgi:hypothetical protein